MAETLPRAQSEAHLTPVELPRLTLYPLDLPSPRGHIRHVVRRAAIARERVPRTPPDLPAVPEVVKRHPREPLRLVVELCAHVEEDAKMRPCVDHASEEYALLPAALTVAVRLCARSEGALSEIGGRSAGDRREIGGALGELSG